jgi:hypothetical protein
MYRPTSGTRAPAWRQNATPTRLRAVAACAALLTGLILPGSSRAAPSAPAPAGSCRAAWAQVPTPDHGVSFRGLPASSQGYWITALPHGDVWGVGNVTPSGTNPLYPSANLTDVEHWNGHGWKSVPAPTVPLSNTQMSYISFDAPGDGWIAGSNVQGIPHATVEHWDGTRWTISPTLAYPYSGNPGGTLAGFTALSATDAWLAEARPTTLGGSPGPQNSFLQHWNGRSWRYVKYPLENSAKVPLISAIYGIKSATPDIWLAVTLGKHSTGDFLHWDGSTWTTMPVPIPPGSATGGNVTHIAGFSGTSPDDVWAVGSFRNSSHVAQPLAEHWDGTSWTAIPVPMPATASTAQFQAVAPVSSSSVWAVGQFTNGVNQGQTQNLAEHWDGTAWAMASVPDSPGPNSLNSVSAVSSTDLWAGGLYQSMNSPQGSPFPYATRVFRYRCGG